MTWVDYYKLSSSSQNNIRSQNTNENKIPHTTQKESTLLNEKETKKFYLKILPTSDKIKVSNVSGPNTGLAGEDSQDDRTYQRKYPLRPLPPSSLPEHIEQTQNKDILGIYKKRIKEEKKWR